jgi:hypothetical protein
VLNYKNEVPEYNLKQLESIDWFSNNRPIKFVFMKDLEDPYYNQILYVPITYNLYDGLTPACAYTMKTLLDKPFTFDVNPSYSTTNNLSGSGTIYQSKL